MNECLKCGAPREWKTRHDAARSKEGKFLSHPKGVCRNYINDKLKNSCNLFEQDFGIPRACEDSCGRQVYSFEIKIGITSNKICFDTPGPPWNGHNCQSKEILARPVVGYEPCIICAYVSMPGSLRQPFLGFKIQINPNGFHRDAFIVVHNPKDNKQFVADLHQPFFYKEIRPDFWVMNTYQKIVDNITGLLSYTPKDYNCWKIDHKSIKGWRGVFGDEDQRPLNL
jgi:hypothetical protein